MPELLDIVNERDETIGQMDFADILKGDYIIRVSHVWVVNEQKQVLLQLRKSNKSTFPRHFDATVGGKVNPGETYLETARRETAEEIGLQNADLVAGGKYFVDMPGVRKFVQTYIVHSNGPFIAQPEEVERLEWFSLPDLDAAVKRYPYFFVPNILPSINAVRNLI